jgi:RNA polymerase sigma-70 factor, ECF subfamily
VTSDAGRAAEKVARQSYGKLIAFLAARSRDVPAAEDALSEALTIALRVWPERGIPDNPEGWLLTAARRNLIQAARHRSVHDNAQSAITLAFEEAEEHMNDAQTSVFPDEWLKLLFACTHPAIDRSIHTPLMLQTVLGIDAKTMAQAFVVSPEAMSQRLVRAKVKIRDAGIPFTIPERQVLTERLEAVLSAIYAAYGLGWEGLDGEADIRTGLTGEAIWLGRALLTILPEEPEVMGLLSLMLYCEARRHARRDADGGYIPLEEQDTCLWNDIMMAEADALLRKAGTVDRFGPFQCQAAIQSVHATRRRTEATDWQALVTLYRALIAMRPTLGAEVSHAAVIGKAEGAASALALLDRLEHRNVAAYQPYWAVRAHLLAVSGQDDAASEAYRIAIGLSDNPAVRTFLSGRLQTVISRSA